jgi:hypothetical protein
LKLHLVYRLYGGENRKGRPPFYSKQLALASALRAAQVAQADFVVLADGTIPDHLQEMVTDRAQVVYLVDGPVGMRKSFIAGLKYPDVAGWPDDDLVYFCEDDYLHEENSFARLIEAAIQITWASYFALYASTPQHPVLWPGLPYFEPADWIARPPAQVHDHRWVNVPSTASTFGARVGALRRDRGIMRQALVPYRTRYLDHEMHLVHQGRLPYSASELFLGPKPTRFRTGLAELGANIILTPFRMAYNARAFTRRKNPHLLYAADPNLASHLETAFMAEGLDWARQARDTEEWARAVGLWTPTSGC